jgi:protein-tyrosine phosphatase
MSGAAMLDISWITPDVALGACFPSEEIELLAREHGIRGVVDLREEACDGELELAQHGIELLHLPTRDHEAVAPEMLRAGVAFSARHLDRGNRVLLHCQHGIGRSGLLALCVLVDRGLSPIAALALAKGRRERISPSPAQYDAWAAWLTSRGVPAPAFEAFAEIAYRHLRTT